MCSEIDHTRPILILAGVRSPDISENCGDTAMECIDILVVSG